MMHTSTPEDYQGKRITVMGLGRFGGGAGVTRWLVERGAQVLVTDLQSAERLGPQLPELLALGNIRLRLGEHRLEDFQDRDLIVVNPAVSQPWANPYLARARECDIPITSEITLLLEQIDPARVIGVTGTAGKSTTASMIAHILQRSGRQVSLGGNIGGSLLPLLHEIPADTTVVVELSSAMLYWLGLAQWSPGIAVMTNLHPNHIDWHGSLDHYRQCKNQIFQHQGPDDHRFDEQDLPDAPEPTILRLPGSHNQRNAQLAALAAARAAAIEPADAIALLEDFGGLPHRLELVADIDGKRCYNDSKSTTPESTVLAVDAFDDPGKIHLIAGGYDKKVDLSAIANLAAGLGGLYVIGDTGPKLAEMAGGETYRAGTLQRAVETALLRMGPTDVLLLSPGCASWDQFESFEQRGEMFSSLVKYASPTAELNDPVT
jgi:UDP-N-acetylmuramoylalanine--D-glutamate ligase